MGRMPLRVRGGGSCPGGDGRFGASGGPALLKMLRSAGTDGCERCSVDGGEGLVPRGAQRLQ